MATRKNAPKSTFKFSKPKEFVNDLTGDIKTGSSLSMNFLQKKRNIFIIGLVLFILLLAGLGYFFRNKFIVAVVDGKPIFRYQLTSRLTQTYGKDTLENMIIEQLIKEEASRKGVTTTDNEINSEIKKVEESLGAGLKLEDALKFQGLSLADFKNQITLKLQVNKILDKEISVTADEVTKYILDNDKLLVATAEAERKVEAEQKLKEQKIGDRIQAWVSELLAKAKITRFLQ